MVVAIIGIIAAIAVPALLRARLSAQEAAAIGSMRVVSTSEASYASTCGACESRCGLLVTTHDGRPTKIDGSARSSSSAPVMRTALR